MVEIFKEYIADIFTIQAWRSLWYLEDKFIYPNNSIKSACISLLIGLPIYIILYMFNQRANSFISSNIDKKSLIKNSTTSIEKEETIRLTCISKYLLNMTFIFSFISTVNVWRGLWMLQLDLCYPIIFESSTVVNQMVLNAFYMLISLLILWKLNLTSTLLSRSNTQDNYFTLEKNCVISKNTFKKFFKKVILVFYCFFFTKIILG